MSMRLITVGPLVRTALLQQPSGHPTLTLLPSFHRNHRDRLFEISLLEIALIGPVLIRIALIGFA
jgi:hypothetical protein